MPVWRNPAVWIALTALAIPLAVHLLARVRARQVAFPSLRFIQQSRLAALKRRTLTDWLLLTVRMAILALAVAAFANPLFLTAARRVHWAARVSRVIVIDTSESMSRLHTQAASRAGAERERDVQTSTTIEATTLREGVERAVAWLKTTPPSRREIVCISDFQLGTVDAALLQAVPDDIGLRFLRISATATDGVHERTADARPATTRRVNRDSSSSSSGSSISSFEWHRTQVRVTDDAVAVIKRAPAAALPPINITTTTDAITIEPFGLRVSAAHHEQAALLAAIRAVLAEGVPAPASVAGAPRAVVLQFASADEPLPATSTVGPLSAPWMADALDRISHDAAFRRGMPAARDGAAAPPAAREAAPAPWLVVLLDAHGAPMLLAASRSGALQLLARMPASAASAPLVVRAVLRAVAGSDPLPEAETRTLSDRALNAWTRPPAEPPADAFRDIEDSDRRWLWAAVLVTLLLETWLRRDRPRRGAPASHADSEAHERAA